MKDDQRIIIHLKTLDRWYSVCYTISVSKAVNQRGRIMQHVTFHNVTIAIRAKDGKAAYAALCNQLAKHDWDWYSDTYTIEDGPVHRVTAELFPETR